MHYAFEGIRCNVRDLYKPQKYTIDNLFFQLHYRLTTLFLVTAVLLHTSRHYFGDSMKCICDKAAVPEHVINTYCFFTSTFSVVKHLDPDLLDKEVIAHPGVGPLGINSTEKIIHHTYYQWVPFVLTIQAIMFWLPRLLWWSYEGGKLRKLVDGLHCAAFSFCNEDVTVGDITIPSTKTRDIKMMKIQKAFIDRLYVNRIWSLQLIFCEFLNLLNVILQVYINDRFLGGNFLNLGVEIYKNGYGSVDALDVVFPKVSKCNFHKYGPSGSIQVHDAICVLGLNILNEKIYLFFWFWYLILFCITLWSLLWRLLTLCLHARSQRFNEIVFSYTCPGKLNPWRIVTVTRYCSYTDWLFLRYLSKNLDGFVFRRLFIGLAEELDKIASRPLLSRNHSIDITDGGNGKDHVV